MPRPRQDRSSPTRSKVPPKSLLPSPDNPPRNALHRASSVSIPTGLSNWHRRPKTTTTSSGQSPRLRKGKGLGMGLESTPAKRRVMSRSKGKSLGAHSTPRTARNTSVQSPRGGVAVNDEELSLPASSFPSSPDLLTPSAASTGARSISSPSLPSIRPVRHGDVFGDTTYFPGLTTAHSAAGANDGARVTRIGSEAQGFRLDSPFSLLSPENVRSAAGRKRGGEWDTSGISAPSDDIELFHSALEELDEESGEEVEITEEEMEKIMILDEIVPMPLTSESVAPSENGPNTGGSISAEEGDEEDMTMRVRDYTVPLPPDDTTMPSVVGGQLGNEATPRAVVGHMRTSSWGGKSKTSSIASKIKSRPATPYKSSLSRPPDETRISDSFVSALETLPTRTSKSKSQGGSHTMSTQTKSAGKSKGKSGTKRFDDPFAPSLEDIATPGTRAPFGNASPCGLALPGAVFPPFRSTQSLSNNHIRSAPGGEEDQDDEYEALPNYVPNSSVGRTQSGTSSSSTTSTLSEDLSDPFGFRHAINLNGPPQIAAWQPSTPGFASYSPVSQLDIPTRSPSLLSDRASSVTHKVQPMLRVSLPGKGWRKGAWRGGDVMRRMNAGRLVSKARFVKEMTEDDDIVNEAGTGQAEQVNAAREKRVMEKTVLTEGEKMHRDKMAAFFLELEGYALQVEEVWN